MHPPPGIGEPVDVKDSPSSKTVSKGQVRLNGANVGVVVVVVVAVPVVVVLDELGAIVVLELLVVEV